MKKRENMKAKNSSVTGRIDPQARGVLYSRRDMLKTLGLSGGALLGFGALHATRGVAQTVPDPVGGSLYNEVYPTSPLIVEPWIDEVPIPAPLKPLSPAELGQTGWSTQPGPYNQSCYAGSYHSIWPGNTAAGLYLPPPLIYDIKLCVGEHSFTSSKVMPIDHNGNPVPLPDGAPAVLTEGLTTLPKSTIYGFNGSRTPWEEGCGSAFPGAMIYARYGQPALIRFQNYLDNPVNPLNNLERGDFGDPERRFLTHLHNGHTAPESDGNPNHWEGGYHPGDWCDNLYLNYPAGGDDREKQSFMWFHDHTHGHTGANVFKGMVGLYPIYDPKSDPGDERKGYNLPGVPKYVNGSPKNGIDYDQTIDYDIPLALFDCSFDDGVTRHKDAHDAADPLNPTGVPRPEWWGRAFFKHFPNHGFVGDVFTVNCKAFPVLRVKRRRYRLRFLDASIARCYDLVLMNGNNGYAAKAFPGQQGQYNIGQYDGAGNFVRGGQQCMVFTQISSEGGLLPFPIVRDSIELWPAKRREVIVDFSKYMDGTPTSAGDVMYLVNTMKMVNGRKPVEPMITHDDNDVPLPQPVPDPEFDPKYAVPVLKIIVEAETPADNSIDPLDYSPATLQANNGKAALRMVTDPKTGLPVPALRMRSLPPVPRSFRGLPVTTFELQRSGTYGGEIEWLINGHAFDMRDIDGMVAQARPLMGRPELWIIRNGGGGWVHPMHMHQEEHRVISRKGGRPRAGLLANGLQLDDNSREDVIALDPGEEVMIYRNFRSFRGKYVAHCHNLAHEDHAMMFGFEIM
jgi:FtsP/CotA-like multicopper oxidase with cupredoxin domain